MILRANLALRLAFGLCGPGGFVCLSTAHAQTAGGADPQNPPAYQDRYIGGGSLVPDISTGDEGTSDAQGLARSLELDGVASVLRSHGAGSDANVMENGVIARAQWETVAYGAWSLDASARTGGSNLGPSEQGQGGVVSLRQ